MGYLTVKTVEEVNGILANFRIKRQVEKVKIFEGLNRELAEDVYAPISLPPFNRSAVDGYCVNWEDVAGASESLPIFLKVVGNIEMGQKPKGQLEREQAMVVATGSMLPEGANAVVMVEETERLAEDEVAIYSSVACYENVLVEGEDVKKGELVLAKGTKLTPENISLLAALGITEVEVFQKIQVGILSTGDELVEVGEEAKLGQIYNSNGPGLIAAVSSCGAIPRYYGIIEDDFNVLKESLEKAVKECQLVILTGGTSIGTKDYVVKAIDGIGKPGVLVHGIAIKPGKPTIIGAIDSTPIFGLSGNPFSALLGFRLFVQKLLAPSKEIFVKGKVARNIPSTGGRQDYIPVTIVKKEDGLWLNPLFSKSNSIGVLSKMDGLLVIEAASEGLEAGQIGKVMLKEGINDDLFK
ncbi:molybdopterin molybdochelatase [Anaerobranca californiensis DSM 14826]|uniref:Molybdopterin molybdenumtransferase n=1 Tax=Anaerobranca californiensis DSM 14826 TaxID=1120989 RepID=A0A1M6QAV0_9FIRM|nr:gephyrin-like molybdotransferase Glp [Anaerobranca californiensis]SHK17372.1 molybdopterin molybdochelatase [Anaerobranca californiensis DSM 14826]